MAVRFLNASANLSSSAGSWRKVEASYMPPDNITAYTDAYNSGNGLTTASINLVSCTVVGAFVFLRQPTTPAGGTYSVELWEGAVLKATSGTLNCNDLPVKSCWFYVPFQSTYFANGNYTLKVKASAGARIYWWGSTTTAATVWGYGIISNADDTTKIASGDTAVLKQDVNLAVDEDWQPGPTNAGLHNTNLHSVLHCGNSTVSAGQPSSLVTVNLGTGNICAPSHGAWKIGTSGARTGDGVGERFRLTNSIAANGVLFDLYANYTVANYSTNVFEFFGNVCNTMRLNADADAASGQTTITTVEDIPSTWTVGDVIHLAGKDTSTYDSVTYTIASKSTKSFTVNTNLNIKLLQGASILNVTEAQRYCGISIRSTNNIRFAGGGTAQYCDYYRMDGVYLENVVPSFPTDTTSVSATSSFVNNVMCVYSYNSQSPNFVVQKAGFFTSNVHISSTTSGQAVPVILMGKNGYAFNITLRNMTGINTTTYFTISGTNCWAENMVFASGTGSATYHPLYVTGYANTIKNSYLFGGRLFLRNAAGFTFDGFNQERSVDYGLYVENCVSTTFNNSRIGRGSANATKDIYHATDFYSQILMTNCNFGSQGVDSNITTAVPGSWLRSLNHNNNTGENRAWTPEGLMYFTAATSNKIEAWNLQNAIFTNRYNIGTESVSGMGIRISVKCQINDAAFYAGSYELPKLRVTYDNGTEIVSTAAANTSEQTLAVAFTPSTNGNPISIKLTERCDDAGEPSEVKWSNLKIDGALYGYNFSSWTKIIDRMTDDTIYAITTPTTNTLITSDLSTVATFTGMSINHSTQAVVTNGAGGVPVNSIAKAYDYSQYDYTQHMDTAAIWLYSIDGGLSYYCDYDWSISGANISASDVTLRMKSGKMLTMSGAYWTGPIAGNITLASAGTYPIIISGNRTITFSASGTFDLRSASIPGTITVNNTSGGNVTLQLLPGVTVVNSGPNITLDNTVSVNISGSNIVAGSVLYIQNTTDGTNIVNAINAGTTYSGSVNYSSNKNLSIVIRKKGYKSQEFTGTLTATGFSFVAAQEADGTVNSSYDATSAALWSYNTTTKKFSTTATTQLLTVQDFHSYWNDYFANTARMMFPVPTSAATKYDVNLINGASFNLDTEYKKLKTGSITEITSDDFYGSVISLGNASSESLYIIQNGSKITPYWNAGNIDILVKTKAGGSWVNGGLLDVFTRDYSRIYCHGTVTANEGGKNYVSITTGADTNNTTAVGSLPGTITKTEAAQTGKKIDSADTAGNYDFMISAGGATVQQVFEWLKFITDINASGTINGVAGYKYTRWSGSYPELQNGPLATFLAGKGYFANGLWLEGVSDPLNMVLTDNSGVVHTAALPPVSLSVTNLVTNSRLQLYDLTTDTELFNDIVPASSYSMDYTYPGTDHDIRVRVMYVNGATAKKWYETQGTATINGMNVRVSQEDFKVYNDIGIDGSTVTECGIVGTDLVINVDDPDNEIAGQRILAFETYWLYTEDGMRDQKMYIEATDMTHFVFQGGLQIMNLDVLHPLNIIGANIVPEFGKATDVFNLSNGASIALNFNRVEGFPYSSGSGLSSEEHTKLLTVADQVDFIKKIEGGRWKISGTQMIFYDVDNTTEIARFNLLDKDGIASAENVFERVRV